MAAHVQTAVGAADGTSAVTGTGGTGFGVSTTAGNSIVVGISWGSGTINLGATPVSDSKGNTYTAGVSMITGNSRRLAIYYCLAPTMGASHTVTFTIASSSFDLQIIAHEVSGLASFGSGTSDAAEAGTPVDAPAILPGANGAYFFGHVRACAAAGQTFAPNTTSNLWVEQGEVNHGADSDSQAQYFVQTTAASITCDWTMSSTGNAICAQAVFLPSVAAVSTKKEEYIMITS